MNLDKGILVTLMERKLIIPEILEGGHGGGDTGLMQDFIELCLGNKNDSRTNPRVSLESHIMAFAAETSRVTEKVIKMDEYIRTVKENI